MINLSLIDIQGLTFAYEGSYDPVFEAVSFQMDTDWKLGFTGRNGRGKTTFLQLLMGRYEYTGRISASVVFDYFPFPVADPAQDTRRVLEGICSDFQEWELSRELSLLEVEERVLDRPFRTLSNGEQTKVLLAALFLQENHFLLIDEPTNHLDAGARAIVSRYLRGKKGFILVSHDRAFLDACVDHILSINKTDIVIQQGNFSSWLQNKQAQDQNELQESERLKKDIRRLSESARRTAAWSDKTEASKIGTHAGDRGFIGHKAAKMMKRSKAVEARRQSAAEEKSKLLKNIEKAPPLSIQPLLYHAERLVEARELSIAYEEHVVCEGIGFTLRRGDRLGLLGKNGSGKSSLLKLILGEAIAYGGELYIANQLRISYVSQDTSFLAGNLSAFAAHHGLEESLFKAILRKLDFERVQFEKDLADFSEGQKKKVLIAKSLCERAHLYIWDEPLNFIDVLSRMQIEALILAHRPTMLLVEHDRAFMDAVATGYVEL